MEIKKVGIITDSNCDISKDIQDKYDIGVLPMPILVEGETFYENIDISKDDFYKWQAEGKNITSSQPSPAEVMKIWNSFLEKYETIVYIPMTSGLSGACQNAKMFAEENEYKNRVFVVDNHRISVPQFLSIMDAVKLREAGKSAQEIKAYLEEDAYQNSIYITVDTLEYLKKGGRITPAAAMLGGLLHIKPILTIQGEKLDTFSKARSMHAAFKIMEKQLHEELDTRFKELDQKGEIVIGLAYSYLTDEEVSMWKEKLQESFPSYEIVSGRLMLSIGCHTGPGALGIAIIHKL